MYLKYIIKLNLCLPKYQKTSCKFKFSTMGCHKTNNLSKVLIFFPMCFAAIYNGRINISEIYIENKKNKT